MRESDTVEGRQFYNFTGAPNGCAPLPFRAAERIIEPDFGVEGWQTIFAIVPRPDGRECVVRLDTDSPHIALFFRLNWGYTIQHVRHDVRLIVRRGPANAYSLPDEYGAGILVDAHARCAAITGNEYYTKTKTSLRMLCSTLCGDDELYLHGCSVEINGVGVLICGYSGVGKTTLMRAMRDRPDVSLRLVNDDWSPLSLNDFACRHSGERSLHMKYPTVVTIAPNLDPRPDLFPSEYFDGDVRDPRARMMIERDRLFPTGEGNLSATIGRIWLLTRHDARSPLIRTLGRDDAALFEGAGAEANAGIQVEYLNGAFLFPQAPNLAKQHVAHVRMLDSGRVWLINNSGDPATVAARLISTLGHAAA
jgi:hypothetical protein